MVIKLGSLGDVIQADGAFRDIRAAYPNAEIVALTMPAYRKLLDRCPWIDRVLTDPRKPRWRLDAMAGLRRRLRAERFGMVFDLQTQNRTNAYRRWFLPGVRSGWVALGAVPDQGTS
ncbi:MAG: ADP-heptose--LPS heptosyltransferase, partial [Pseudomonadota bacterium]